MASEDFQERVRAFRKALGLGVNELNDAAGLTSGTVSHIEKGNRPNVGAPILERLANYFGVSMDFLWRGNGGGAPDPVAASFLTDLEHGLLRETIEREPGRWKLSTIAQAVQTKVPKDKDGVPLGGWGEWLDAIEAHSASKPLPAKLRKPSKTKP